MANTDGFIRLQKFLAEFTDVSRRKAEEYIESGKVTVDGKKAKIGQKVLGTEDIFFLGKQVKPIEKSPVLIAFNKPAGVECTYEQNDKTKNLNDFYFAEERVFPVGRLDKDSKGLLLMTNNGELANQLMHPKFEHEKEYYIVVNRKIDDDSLKKLSNGSITLDGKKVQPCKVQKISGKIFTIVLKEGKNRQIRRMCEKCNMTVKELLRTRIGKIQLGKLSTGAVRKLKINQARQSFGI